MSDGTKIEWTDATWNVVNGCSVVSPGCKRCYAMKQAHRFPVRQGLTQHTAGGMVWTGEVRFNAKVLLEPLRWRRPRKIFVCAHGDLFHENVPVEWIDQVFAVMALARHHTFQVLTKRPERMREYLLEQRRGRPAPRVAQAALKMWKEHLQERGGSGYLAIPGSEFDTPNLICWPLPNVWLGVSVEDQQRADERIPILLDTPAAVRWLSCEPLLGPVDLGQLQENLPINAWLTWLDALDWLVAGGESGPGARPMHPDWARSLRDQCAAAGVPFLFKQWGAWLPGENFGDPLAKWQDGEAGQHSSTCGKPDSQCPEWRHFGEPGTHGAFAINVGKKRAGRLLDGVQHDGYPG